MHALRAKSSTGITREVRKANRVVFDWNGKQPVTTEWQ